MQLRAEEISQIIKKQIQSYEKATLTTEKGGFNYDLCCDVLAMPREQAEELLHNPPLEN